MSDFKTIIKAIHTHDWPLVTEMIRDAKEDSTLFSEVDNEQNSLLHHICKHCREENAATLTLLLDRLIQFNKLANLAPLPNSAGQTALHLVIIHNSCFAIETMIKKLGVTANIVARSPDNLGWLPIDLVKKLWKKSPHLLALLTPATLYNPLPKLSQKLDSEEVIRQYGEEKNSPNAARLNRNLLIATNLVNQARSTFFESETHPDTNNTSLAFALRVFKQIENTREQSNLKKRLNLAIKKKSANCSEFALYVYRLIKQLYPFVKGELFYLDYQSGDHEFLIIDFDPANGGKSAVVCDPWAGKVYPYSEIPKQLLGFRRIDFEEKNADKIFVGNVSTLFNPYFNKIKYHASNGSYELEPEEVHQKAFIAALQRYIVNRKNQAKVDKSSYGSVFGRVFGFDDQTKIAAAELLIRRLKGEQGIVFSSDHIEALRDGTLSEVVVRYADKIEPPLVIDELNAPKKAVKRI